MMPARRVAATFRGFTAAASLKLRIRRQASSASWLTSPRLHRRGLIEADSTVLCLVDKDDVPLPRLHRRGLIEASVTGGRNGCDVPIFRGFTAAASLKQQRGAQR